MALHFRRVDTELEIWIASSGDCSFVISNESVKRHPELPPFCVMKNCPHRLDYDLG
ncbi:hypothetical protein ACVIWU_002495 [Bradyrhizobium sp. USDA 4509]